MIRPADRAGTRALTRRADPFDSAATAGIKAGLGAIEVRLVLPYVKPRGGESMDGSTFRGEIKRIVSEYELSKHPVREARNFQIGGALKSCRG